MPRRFITELTDRENIDEVFVASEKQLRTNRNGNLYLQIRLADRTGSITAMLWNAGDAVYNAFNNGDYLRIRGTTQVHNGGLQIILQRFDVVDPKSVDEADFTTLGAADVDRLAGRLAQLLRGMRNVPLRELAESFLVDEEFMAKFAAAPAGVKNHHAYRGGLLDHVVSLMELCAIVVPRYPDVDPDLLLMGAFLHDMGKIDELSYERDLGYTDEGQLLGHVVIAIGILNDKLREVERLRGEEFPHELALRLKHMIISHHGEYEFGAPKLPMTLEAVALHYLDTLDAKLFSMGQLIRDDVNTDSRWTTFFPTLQRKLYKG